MIFPRDEVYDDGMNYGESLFVRGGLAAGPFLVCGGRLLNRYPMSFVALVSALACGGGRKTPTAVVLYLALLIGNGNKHISLTFCTGASTTECKFLSCCTLLACSSL